MRGYPKWFYRFLVTSFVLLTLSGLLLIPNALVMRLEWDMNWGLSGSQRLAVVAIHALIAFLTASQMGALWSVHMRIGCRHHKNIATGFGLTAILLALVFSGIGIYYLDESGSVLASAMHIVIGLFLPLLFVYHIVKGRGKEKVPIR